MMILGVFTGHDAGAALFEDYRLVAAVSLERMTRIKCDGFRFPDEAVDECLAVAGIPRSEVDVLVLPRARFAKSYFRNRVWWDLSSLRDKPINVLRQMMYHRGDTQAFFDGPRFLSDHGFSPKGGVAFYDHHLAHALDALFHTDWSDAVLYTSDGGGDRLFYSARELGGGQLREIFGTAAQSLMVRQAQRSNASLALLYGDVTGELGFTRLRHEGKVLGLAAFGKPRFQDLFRAAFRVDDAGLIHGTGPREKVLGELKRLVEREPREDIAASLQAATEDVTLMAIRNLMRGTRSRRLGVAGGLFANVRVNQRIAEECEVDELFVYPAMSDQGVPAGGVLQVLLQRDGLATWLDHRRRLDDVYLGRDYAALADQAHGKAGAKLLEGRDLATTVARMIHDGAAVGTFLGRMEYGPRALGARSIMARATERAINNSLNDRLSRTDFMPFAPVVLAERAREVFDLPASLTYTASFMTTTCRVRPEWQDRIPAVVHVDGTARPQVIRREQNALYYDILKAYEQLSGLPVLINTSFNAHEEPIINTPEECATALMTDRVDAVVTPTAIWTAPKAQAA